MTLHPLTGEVVSEDEELFVFPATHYVAGPERMETAITGIELELADRLAEMERQGKLLEAQRLRMRTTYDIEMMRQVGFCSGIENYSRHIDGRARLGAQLPARLLPEDFLLVIDESHVTVPQIGGMYEGDMSRKRTLVDHGFRLPSAMDNRPLKWEEFLGRIGQTVYLSATPGPTSCPAAGRVVEQVIRPTGLVDPEVVVKPTKGQIDDLVHEIKLRADRRRAGAGHDADQEDGRGPHRLPPRARHPGPLPALRGRHPAPRRAAARAPAWGVRRPGRHQPAARGPRPARGVARAILDADKEGFLRSGTSLIQTIGRAARNVSARSTCTPTRSRLDGQGDRRDQPAPGQAGRLQRRTRCRPQPLRKRIADITDLIAREDADTEELIGGSGRQQSRGKVPSRHVVSGRRTPRRRAGQPAGGRAGRPDPVAHGADARLLPQSCTSSSPPGCATRSPS
jgi:excinuclease ABC subunit B